MSGLQRETAYWPQRVTATFLEPKDSRIQTEPQCLHCDLKLSFKNIGYWEESWVGLRTVSILIRRCEKKVTEPPTSHSREDCTDFFAFFPRKDGLLSFCSSGHAHRARAQARLAPYVFQILCSKSWDRKIKWRKDAARAATAVGIVRFSFGKKPCQTVKKTTELK